jgi:hypothetical protein
MSEPWTKNLGVDFGKTTKGDYPEYVLYSDHCALLAKYESAVRTLQDIAAMGRKAGSESAAHRLAQLGEPREPEETTLSGTAARGEG